MPIFEYRCEDCGTAFEKLVRRSETVECPSCGQRRLSQQFSTFAAHSDGGFNRSEAPACPGGMCSTPGLCGRN